MSMGRTGLGGRGQRGLQREAEAGKRNRGGCSQGLMGAQAPGLGLLASESHGALYLPSILSDNYP